MERKTRGDQEVGEFHSSSPGSLQGLEALGVHRLGFGGLNRFRVEGVTGSLWLVVGVMMKGLGFPSSPSPSPATPASSSSSSSS